MSRLRVLAAIMAPIALTLLACDASTSRSGSPPITQSAGASEGGATATIGGAAPDGSAGQTKAGGGAQAAGEASGGSAAGGMGGSGGSSNVAGMPSSTGAGAGGDTGWIIPEVPGTAWSGPQDPACPSAAVSADSACASPPGTRCSYAESGGDYTLRCQCYTSSTGAALWWCQHHWNSGYDSCPVAYPGNGSCPNIGDVTCYYVDEQDKLEACNCSAGSAKCLTWGL